MKINKNLLYGKIKNKILDLRISTKITLFYFILVVCSLSISVLIYQKMYLSVMLSEIQNVSTQTLYSINSNINSTIENVNNFSKAFIMDYNIRNALKSSNNKEIIPNEIQDLIKSQKKGDTQNNNSPKDIPLSELEKWINGYKESNSIVKGIPQYEFEKFFKGYSEGSKNPVSANEYTYNRENTLEGQGLNSINLSKHLNQLIEVNPIITSVFILDFDGFSRGYQADKLSDLKLISVDTSKSDWYKKVIEKNGGYILSYKADGIFQSKKSKSFVSLIRVIRDIDDQKPIGILILNISGEAFENSYKGIAESSDVGIMLLDTTNDTITSNKAMKDLKAIETYKINSIISHTNKDDNFSQVIKINNQEYIQSYLGIENYKWKLLSFTPLEAISKQSNSFSFITLIIILINGLMLFVGAVFISRMITTPIKKLINAMKGVEKREFKTVDIKERRDEIGKLRACYNMMVSEIQNLINQSVEEEKIKRKAELNILQAQVKPHFLYNTLDAMGYLALSGKGEELYEALEALGSYYRTSLSKGREVITIKEEIDIVKSYLLLQNLRYGDIFTAEYDIDENAYKYKTLKLVLQPLVENSLYHGIKAKGEPGIIKISVKLNDDNILISVEDDGIGMSEEDLEKITQQLDQNSSSFGLKGTIKRLQIFYGITDIYSIESQKRYGTRVNITIPLERGVEIE